MNEFILNPQYGGYQRELVSIVCKFFNKKTGSRTSGKARANVHEVLAQEFHITVVKNSKEEKDMQGLKKIFRQ